MLKQPRFKPHLRVQIVPGEGAFVLSDSQQILLRGRLYELVVPQIGGRSADAVCDQLHEQVSPAEVYYVLAQLEKKGYLCEEEDSLPPGEAALWSAQQMDPGTVARRLAEVPVSVQAFGMEPSPVCELLRALGVRVQPAGNPGFPAPFADPEAPCSARCRTPCSSLCLVLADNYLRSDLEACNRDALQTGRPWLLVRPFSTEVWVGPLFRPGITGCWECLAQRLRANRPVESYLDAKDGQPASAADRACSAATLQIALGLAAQAVATWIARGDLPALEGRIQTFDVVSWQMRVHTLVRLPYCPACGVRTANDQPMPSLTLERRTKTFTCDGGHRVVPPEVTLQRYGHHVSPLTGAVTMLERVGPNGDGAMHVYVAGHNLARRHRSLDHLRGDLRNLSSGKGASDLQARASGLCEGLERHSGVFRGDEFRIRARFDQLGGSAIAPNDCHLFSDRQFQQRDTWNASGSHYNFVPVPFDHQAGIEWTPLWSLTRKERRYLPTAFCYYNYPDTGEPFCMPCSNGNAAGNTLEEAILQGFLELVERDGVALWWYNHVARPGVDVASFADPYLDKVQEFLRQHGRQMWVLDLTTDLKVPVFAAISRATDAAEERIVLGFGAHLDAHVALLRAVTEMNQMLSNLLPSPGRNASQEDISDLETVHWLRTATIANQPYLLADPAAPLRTAADHPHAWTDDVSEDVRGCQALVERLGMEMLVLDQTRPEIGLPVAKVVVPGLRHFWARFAPGRLYDVPVQLGWLSRPLVEAELNPIPMFL